MRLLHPLFFTISALSVAQATPLIQDLGAQHNAIILGNLRVDSADTEGRQLVTGDFTTNIGFNYSIGVAVEGSQNPPEAGRDDLIVGGGYFNQSPSGGVIVTEDAVIGGNADQGITFQVASGNSSGQGTLTTNAGSLSIDRSTGNVSSTIAAIALSGLQNQLSQESMQLSQLSTSSGITANVSGQNLDITTTDPGFDSTYTLNLSADQWYSGISSRSITSRPGDTIIINVAGSDIDITYGNMTLSGTQQSKLIVNYYEAQTFNVKGFLHEGSILAPNTTSATIDGGAINGVAFLGGEVLKTGSGEFHNFNFDGDLPVPEPSTSLLLALGCLSFVIRRKK